MGNRHFAKRRNGRRSLTAEVLSGLTRGGKAGAVAGRELDALRSLGPWRYWRQARDPTAAELGGRARTDLYERLWREAAEQVGVEVREAPPGYLELRRAGRTIRLWRHLVPLDDPVTLQLAGDKPAAHAVLTSAGVPVPAHRTVRVADVDEALAFVQEQGRCVVKPASGTGAGRGITGGVTTRPELLRARLRAARFDPERLLLEAHATGDEYRVLVLDGEAIGAVRRVAPRVVGDGSSNIAELVDVENRRRRKAAGTAGLWPIRLDLDALIELRRQGLTRRSTPRAGEVVTVKSSTSEAGDQDAWVLDVAAPEVAGAVESAAAAAAAIGSLLASVELVTMDAGPPLSETGGVVIEVNTTPGIAQHYLVANPADVVPVAAIVLKRLLER